MSLPGGLPYTFQGDRPNTITSAFPAFDVQAVGEVAVSGGAISSFPLLVQQAAAEVLVSGSAASLLPVFTTDIAGVLIPPELGTVVVLVDGRGSATSSASRRGSVTVS